MLRDEWRFYSPDDGSGASGGGGQTDDGSAGKSGSGKGDGGAGTGDDGGDGNDDDKPVARSDHKRALDDLHRHKNTAAQERKERERLQRELDEIKRKNSGEDLDAVKAELEQVRGEKEQLRGSVILAEKNRAITPALIEAGLRPDAKNIIDMLNLEDLEVEISTHGRVTVHGVADMVKKVKKDFPYAFQVKQAAKVNAGGGGSGNGGGSTDWTPQKIVELESKCQKTGDMAPYKKAVAEYLEQKKARETAK